LLDGFEDIEDARLDDTIEDITAIAPVWFKPAVEQPHQCCRYRPVGKPT